MTLDLIQLAPRISQLVEFLTDDATERSAKLARARDMLRTMPDEELGAALDRAQNASWLVAEAIEPLSTHHAAPRPSYAYAALATDGSSIDVNRHAAAACYVINIGYAWLDYARSEVELASKPELEYLNAWLRRGDAMNASKETIITGNLLDAYRTAQEMCKLAELAEQHAAGAPVVALLDGQFVLWGLKETELSSDARDLIFADGVFNALDRLRAIAAVSSLAAGSYISRPSGREVTNALRIADCPRPGGADCSDCPRTAEGVRPCDEVAGGTDADLFSSYLGPGERSAIFKRRSGTEIDTQYEDAGHGLRFFYVQIPGGEIARIEFPEWVTHAQGGVDLLHASVLDQCERGSGYPLVLQEAHEQAVIDGSARRSFELLLHRHIESAGPWRPPSGKSWSKRRRTI
jgi:hypothetical protein